MSNIAVTPAQAATMWCPHARVGSWASNREVRPDRVLTEFTACIGPRCMAWRKSERSPRLLRYFCDDAKATVEPERTFDVPASWEFVPFDPEDDDDSRAMWLEDDAALESRHLGWCGLAGKP